MEPINNNQFEVIPNVKSKRKITAPTSNAYLNPALDILANEDPMSNNAMEIVPIKKRKRTKSCDVASFENTGLDLGLSKAAVSEFLIKELANVRRNLRPCPFIDTGTEFLTPNHSLVSRSLDSIPMNTNTTQLYSKPIVEPIYANLTDVSVIPISDCFVDSVHTVENTQMEVSNDIFIDSAHTVDNAQAISKFQPDVSEIQMDSRVSDLEQKSLNSALPNNDLNISSIHNTMSVQNNVTNHIFVNNQSNLSLSFIDKLALDSPNISNQSLYFDDDLNESNIMEIKTITIITKRKKIANTAPRNTNPFLDPNLPNVIDADTPNPFLSETEIVTEQVYNDEMMSRPTEPVPPPNTLLPRRLFSGDTNSTISTVNESTADNCMHNEYENVDSYRSESPIYENLDFCDGIENNFNKQSKILGYDVSRFSAIDIMNLNKNTSQNSSNNSNDSKKDLKHTFLKASNKLSKKVLKKIKNTFKSDKPDPNITLNPYEVPRKAPKQAKSAPKESGIENPALNVECSDESDIEIDQDEEHQYETIKTLRNTRLNMNLTPLRERALDNIDLSHNRTNTPGKKVRFDSTLNREKVITGNSFDQGIESPGIEAKLDKYHDELENCINERKFLQQNM